MENRKRGLKLLTIALTATMLVSVMGACGNDSSKGSTEGKTTSTGDAPKVSADAITIWTFADTHSKYFEWVTAEYTQKNPDMKFAIEVMDNNALQDRLAVIISAGGDESPDFVDVEQSQFPKYMSKEKMCFEPLNDYLAKDGIADKMSEARLSLYQFEGKTYGLEHALCPVTLAYRPDLFDENGIAVPTTWDEFKSAGEKFKEKGIHIAAAGDLRQGNGFDDGITYLKAAGLDYVDNDGNLNITPEWKQMMTDMRDMQNNDILFTAETDEDRWAKVAENKIATYITPDWAAGWLRDNVPDQSGKWKMTTLPKLTSNSSSTSCSGGTGLAMMSYTTKDKGQLWDFMKFSQVDTDNSVKKYELINLYPPVFDAMPLCNKPVDYYGGQNLGEMYEQLSAEMPRQNQAAWRFTYTETLNANAYDFCEGNITIDELAKIITDDVNAFLKDTQ